MTVFAITDANLSFHIKSLSLYLMCTLYKVQRFFFHFFLFRKYKHPECNQSNMILKKEKRHVNHCALSRLILITLITHKRTEDINLLQN